MPTYSYFCTNKKCGVETEYFCSIKDRPETVECNKCGKVANQSVTAPHFTINGASFANGYSGPSNYVTLDKLKKAAKRSKK